LKSLNACAAGPIRRGVRHFAAAVAMFLLAMVILLGIGAPVASAAPEAGPGWAYKASFGELAGFYFETPRSPIAVDAAGNIFAVDQNQGSVSIFAPTADGGVPLATISTPESAVRNVAVDPSDATAYVDQNFFGAAVVRRYVSDGAPTPTYSVDPSFEVPQGEGIAVDPTTGDLLVADPGAEGVRRYDTSGTLLETIATPAINPAWIVTAPDGSFYVAPAEGPDVTHFSGTGALLGTISGAGSIHGLGYDASRSIVVVAVGDKLKSYSPAGALRAESSANGSSGIGLAVDSSGLLYEHAVGNLNSYVPATVPGVAAPHVSDIVGLSAHVSAEVDPGAGPPEGSVARFEYSADGGANWTSTPDVSVERTGTEEPDTVEADLTGLKANTDYLVRLVAANSLITKTSASTSFKSATVPPTAITGAATSMIGSTATLNGSVNPNGSLTTFYFEYGSTAAYGSRIPLTSAPVSAGYTTSHLSRTITGLVPGATYHFRIVAENEAGTAEGDDRTFVAGSILSEGRAYEQVTPVASGGTLIDMQQGMLALSGPTGLSYVAKPPGEGTASAPHYSRRLVTRGDDGWGPSVGIDPPIHFNNVGLFFNSTLAVSRDSTHSLTVTNVKLTPEAAEGPDAANLYRKDLRTGTYELVASTSEPGALAAWVNVGDAAKLFLDGTDDLSTIVFASGNPLLPEVTGAAFYRWTPSDGLEVVSRLPDGTIPASAVQRPEIKENAKRWVSADGSRVLFGLEDGRLFMRVDDETVPVAVSELDGEEKPAKAMEIDADGRYAFFSSPISMTADTGAGPAHLYRYDLEAEDLEYIDDTSLKLSTVVQYSTLAVSSDGQSVAYLDEDEDMAIWHQGEAKVLLDTKPTPSQQAIWSAHFSSNGRYLAFAEAELPFNGNSRSAVEGDVYLYDVDAEQLSCGSCIDGEPTTSAFLPLGERSVSNRMPHAVDDEGRLFFTSTAALLPQDTNGVEDVYVLRAGQVSHITPGKGPYPAFLMDVSDDGRDVYFGTDEPLVAQDTNGERDIYDARIGGGIPSQNAPPPTPCSGEGCQGTAPPPPAAGQIGSESAAVAGAKKHSRHHRCKKGRVRVKGKCVKRKGRKAGKSTANSNKKAGEVR